VRGRRGTRNRRERPHRHSGLRDDVALHLPAGAAGVAVPLAALVGVAAGLAAGALPRARHAHHENPNHKHPAATASAAHAPTGEKGGPQ
jgi:hypothetical protein